jgi:predicted short-subunit dehydrogenase-like oxidoreductase (DUF2520 family)
MAVIPNVVTFSIDRPDTSHSAIEEKRPRCLALQSRGACELIITIIGAGKVGRAIGKSAFLAGHKIGDLICRSLSSAVAASRFVGAGTPQASPVTRLQAVDLILISTQDDRIAEAVKLVERLAGPLLRANQGPALRRRRPVVLHTSGALSSQELAPLKARGFAVGSCHPLQTFESARRSVRSIRRSYFCIEGEPNALRAARRLVRDIGGGFFEIPTGQKELYHAGAVLASGGLTALISISLEILELCGLSDKQAMRALFPLIQGTLANIQAVGPRRALTGPVPRGDTGTMKLNTRALALVQPEWAKIYKLLAKRSLILLS